MTEQQYWTDRYIENRTGWDIGYPSTPLKTYIDQLDNKSLRILIPGAGNAYEAEYLFQQGFTQVYVLDISQEPLAAFQKRVPDFPEDQLLQGDFFTHQGQYDLIFEQTFFCSFLPTRENRTAYARQMSQLLNPGGKLVGLWFQFPLNPDGNRPFGGSKEEYLSYLEPYFSIQTFETAYNSIKPRMGKELFGVLKVK
ncbi:MAG: methyltransferase domain-containing protein [Bacteroidota bacterium]